MKSRDMLGANRAVAISNLSTSGVEFALEPENPAPNRVQPATVESKSKGRLFNGRTLYYYIVQFLQIKLATQKCEKYTPFVCTNPRRRRAIPAASPS